MSTKTTKKTPKTQAKSHKNLLARVRDRRNGLLARRPHRSFRRTRRRDYRRELPLPGYIAFTVSVLSVLRQHRAQVWRLIGVATVAGIVLGGIVSQDAYTQISDSLRQATEEVFRGEVGELGQAGLLTAALLLNPTESLSDVQRFVVGGIMIWLWLTTVWLLRQWLLGNKPHLREGIYSAGSPLVASLLLSGLVILQMLPIGLSALVYQGLVAAEFLDSGFGAMMMGVLILLTGTLSLYWVTSTFVALVIVTLPGVYPMRALRAAGDLVLGRRIRVMLRLLWGVGCGVIVWLVLLLPVVLLDAWAKSHWEWLRAWPIVPYMTMLLVAVSAVWMSSYVYMLYRRIVDSDAKS